jgi:ribonuclease HIII
MTQTKPASFVYKLTAEQQEILIDILKHGNYRFSEVPYTILAAATDKCKINIYTSGKCVIQGKEAKDFVLFVLEPKVLRIAKTGYEKILDPEMFLPHIGVDESGKGDLFGPLVIAGVYTDKQVTEQLIAMDIKDSKRISSDKKILEQAKQLRKLKGLKHNVITIGPSTYNKLYTKMRNVNNILAWGHARAIENLLEQVPECPKAVSDQFGNKETLKKALMRRGRKIQLIQKHRAESDAAVAAASVLARASFVSALIKADHDLGVHLFKGASSKVVEAAVELVEKHGAKVLVDTAKCHFETVDKVLQQLSLTREELGENGQAVSRKKYLRNTSHTSYNG